MNIVQPEPWSDFLDIWLFYVLSPGLIFHLMVFAFGCFLIAVASAIQKQIFLIGKRIVHFGGFLIILLIVSGAFNALWNCLVWGNLYQDFGPDTEDDFTPFLPITSYLITTERCHGESALSFTNVFVAA